MIIFKDAITGDELFSDTYQMKLIEDSMYEVTAKYITRGKDCDVDIGGNPSAEGGDDEVESAGAESGLDVVLDNRLVETNFADKKDFLTVFKAYVKSIVKHLEETDPDRVSTFKEKAPLFVKKVKESFKDLQFFQGESMNPDGLSIPVEWRDDGAVPVMIFLKDGLIAEKV